MRKLVLACLLGGASIATGSSAASACDCYGYSAGYYGYAPARVYAYAPVRRVYAYAPAPRVYAYAPVRRAYAPARRVYGYAAAPRVYAYAPAAPVYAYAPVTPVYYDPVWGWTSW